jgi:hypothetical protein
MPEAAIDKYGHSGRPEDNVGTPPEVLERRSIDPVSQPCGMEQAANREFGLRVAALVALHGLPIGGRRSPRPIRRLPLR